MKFCGGMRGLPLMGLLGMMFGSIRGSVGGLCIGLSRSSGCLAIMRCSRPMSCGTARRLCHMGTIRYWAVLSRWIRHGITRCGDWLVGFSRLGLLWRCVLSFSAWSTSCLMPLGVRFGLWRGLRRLLLLVPLPGCWGLRLNGVVTSFGGRRRSRRSPGGPVGIRCGGRRSTPLVPSFRRICLRSSLIAHAALWLGNDPVALRGLRAEPELLPGVVGEVLRLLPPVGGTDRFATRRTTLGGHVVEAGQRVVVDVVAANRDPEVFVEPGVFEPRREPVRHLSFGRGVHFCLGAHLARIEAEIAVRALVERVSGEWSPPVVEVRRTPVGLDVVELVLA